MTHSYGLYGVRLTSVWQFPYAESAPAALPAVTLDEGPASLFDQARAQAAVPLTGGDWVAYATLPDQTVYVRWSGLLEAVIASDGRRIACRPLPGAPDEALQSYLLGAALSFALIKLGMEPLHATVAVVDGVAVGLMGDCGYGKSSLAAAFLQAGHRLLTDDILVLTGNGSGFQAHPGVPRIKLFPEIARRLFGRRVKGTPMNGLTPKLIIPLTADQFSETAVPLQALYLLAPPKARRAGRSRAARVSIRRLTQRQACMELVTNTFNMAVTDPARMERQLRLAGSVAAEVPVKRIAYPRIPSMLAAARDAILADLAT